MDDRPVVAIVDDDPAFRRTLGRILDLHGYEPVEFSGGGDALPWIQEMAPPAVVIDLRLADIPGLQVLEQVKAVAPDTECIMLTGYASEDSAIEAVNLGAFSYLQKPPDIPQLLVMLRRAVEKHTARRELQESRDRFKSIFDNAVLGLYRTTPDGRILMANPALVRMLGFSSFEELAGRNLEEVGFAAQTPWDLFKECIEREGQVVGLESAWIRADGSTLYVRESARAVRDQAGQTLYYEGTVEDISERKRAEQEASRRAAQQEALNAIIAAAAGATDLQTLLETALDRTLAALGLEIGAIWAGDQQVLRGLSMEQALAINQARRAADLPTHEVSTTWVTKDWGQVAVARPELADMARAVMEAGIQASLTVPIQADERHVGGLSAADAQPRVWLAEEVALVEAVSLQISAAVDRLRLLEEAQEHARRMQRLAEVSQALNQPLDAGSVVVTVGQAALSLAGADQAGVCVRQGEAVECHWSHGLPAGFLEQLAARGHERHSPVNWKRLLEPRLIADIDHKPADWAPRQLLESIGCRAMALWPLVYEGRPLAVLSCFYRQPHHWTESEQEAMVTFARQAAVALQNARLYETLQATNRELQKALQARDEMIQNVSHELRTPLTLIMGYLELLLEGGIGSISPEQREALSIVYSQSEALSAALATILDLQSMDERSLSISSVDMGRLLQNWLASRRERVEARGIRLRPEVTGDKLHLAADADLLVQVLDNLLDNAIKFSPDGGDLKIHARREANEVWIAFQDQGIGIPPGQLERIFDTFYQVDGSIRRRFGGLGLGLALCRKIITLHRGRVWAESQGPGQGSTFWVALPLKAVSTG